MAKKKETAAETAATPPTAVTLATVAQDVRLWSEALAGLDDPAIEPIEREKALEAAARCIWDGATKVESFVAFVRQSEAHAEFLKVEAARLSKKAGVLTRACESLRNYAKYSMFTAGQKKLLGHTCELTISSTGRTSVKIDDAEAIPTAYKLLTITLRSDDFDTLVKDAYPGLDADMLLAQVKSLVRSSEVSFDTAAIKAAIEAGDEVPGADLDASGTKLAIS